MSSKAEKAAENHRSFYSCSASVLCAFCEEAGLTPEKAKQEARPFAGGRMVKCGAVLAAEYVLRRRYGEEADAKIAEFERRFAEKNRSLNCKELKGALTGQILRSCRGCVTDSAELLEELCGL